MKKHHQKNQKEQHQRKKKKQLKRKENQTRKQSHLSTVKREQKEKLLKVIMNAKSQKVLRKKLFL